MDYSLYRIHGVENIENIYISSVLSNSQYACICESIIFLKWWVDINNSECKISKDIYEIVKNPVLLIDLRNVPGLGR